MKKSISMLQKFISLQKEIEQEYSSIRLDEMQEHFYIRICSEPNSVIHKSSDASFKQTVSYLYKQLIDCKPDNAKFINEYAHLINEPRDFSKEFFDVVHAYRTLDQHEPSDMQYRKFKKICMKWTLGAINKVEPSKESEWRACEHYLLENGIQYLEKGVCILKKLSCGGEVLQEAWFRYQKQDITLLRAQIVLEQIKFNYGYEFDTEKYYRQYRGKFKESLKFIDWKSDNVERQIYDCFCQVFFSAPPSRKLLVRPDEISEKYGINSKKQLGKIMEKVVEFCQKNPECNREEIWKFIDKCITELKSRVI